MPRQSSLSNAQALRPLTLAGSELVDRLEWYVLLRWLIAAGVMAVGGVSVFLAHPIVWPPGFIGVGALVAAYNFVFYVGQRKAASERRFDILRARNLATAQAVLDLVALTFLIHWSGGPDSPLFVAYLFHIMIASILLPAARVWTFAGVASFLYVFLLAGEKIFSHQMLDWQSWIMPIAIMVWSSAMVAYIGTQVVGSIRARESAILDLKEALSQQADALKERNRQLEAAERGKSNYMRKVSHELKAPLAAQQSMIRVLRRQLAPQLSGDDQDLLARVDERGERLLALVHDLLTLSRAREAGASRHVRQVVPADLISAPLIEGLRQAADKHGVRFEVNVPPSHDTAWVDTQDVEQVIENVAGNAIKYTPRGGSVRLTVALHESCVRVKVEDTGIGMTPEEQAEAGKEFYRSERARAIQVEGTGLGLSIVKSIAAAYGGRVEIQSAVGKGTTVEVVLGALQEGVTA
jgi:signal transduction histidine kinase